MQNSITLHRDLRTGRPIWMDRRREALASSPPQPEHQLRGMINRAGDPDSDLVSFYRDF